MHSAERWRSVLLLEITRYHERGLDFYFRGDAAFAKPELYERLEAESIGTAIRLPANPVLQEQAMRQGWRNPPKALRRTYEVTHGPHRP